MDVTEDHTSLAMPTPERDELFNRAAARYSVAASIITIYIGADAELASINIFNSQVVSFQYPSFLIVFIWIITAFYFLRYWQLGKPHRGQFSEVVAASVTAAPSASLSTRLRSSLQACLPDHIVGDISPTLYDSARSSHALLIEAQNITDQESSAIIEAKVVPGLPSHHLYLVTEVAKGDQRDTVRRALANAPAIRIPTTEYYRTAFKYPQFFTVYAPLAYTLLLVLLAPAWRYYVGPLLEG